MRNQHAADICVDTETIEIPTGLYDPNVYVHARNGATVEVKKVVGCAFVTLRHPGYHDVELSFTPAQMDALVAQWAEIKENAR